MSIYQDRTSKELCSEVGKIWDRTIQSFWVVGPISIHSTQCQPHIYHKHNLFLLTTHSTCKDVKRMCKSYGIIQYDKVLTGKSLQCATHHYFIFIYSFI